MASSGRRDEFRSPCAVSPKVSDDTAGTDIRDTTTAVGSKSAKAR